MSSVRVVERVLPTTMVGSYPRPHWFQDQLNGRDVRVAFKTVNHEEGYIDATATVIRDQEEAGLDIVTDGQMYYMCVAVQTSLCGELMRSFSFPSFSSQDCGHR